MPKTALCVVVMPGAAQSASLAAESKHDTATPMPECSWRPTIAHLRPPRLRGTTRPIGPRSGSGVVPMAGEAAPGGATALTGRHQLPDTAEACGGGLTQHQPLLLLIPGHIGSGVHTGRLGPDRAVGRSPQPERRLRAVPRPSRVGANCPAPRGHMVCLLYTSPSPRDS